MVLYLEKKAGRLLWILPTRCNVFPEISYRVENAFDQVVQVRTISLRFCEYLHIRSAAPARTILQERRGSLCTHTPGAKSNLFNKGRDIPGMQPPFCQHMNPPTCSEMFFLKCLIELRNLLPGA